MAKVEDIVHSIFFFTRSDATKNKRSDLLRSAFPVYPSSLLFEALPSGKKRRGPSSLRSSIFDLRSSIFDLRSSIFDLRSSKRRRRRKKGRGAGAIYYRSALRTVPPFGVAGARLRRGTPGRVLRHPWVTGRSV